MDLAKNKDVKLLSEQIGEKEKRKLTALSNEKRSIWFGLGMFGMVGWSVAVPTILGAMLGIWLDKKYPQSFSWTLTLLILGLLGGGLIAARWVKKEDKEIHQPKTKNDE